MNLDGEIAMDDFERLQSNFGRGGSWDDGDLNGDGVVDFRDFLLMSVNFQ